MIRELWAKRWRFSQGLWDWVLDDGGYAHMEKRGAQGGGLGEREVHAFHVVVTCIDARSAST